MPTKRSLCIVFDLDDTLYKERDYQLSGFKAVAEYCQLVYDKDIKKSISQWDRSGETDIFGRICYELEIPVSCKESLIWVYRNHFPEISLNEAASKAIDWAQGWATSVAVLTDGRSVTQRLKMKALGLSGLPAFISEEWGDSKPGKIRFEAVQKKYKANDYWYIGDNPKKDFLAPNELGWMTVGLVGDQRNTHSQKTDGLPKDYFPKIWITSVDEIIGML